MKEYKYTINGNKYDVEIVDIVENIATVTVNGENYSVEMEKEPEPEKKKVVIKSGAQAQQPEAAASEGASAAKVNSNNALKAPLPGVIREINVAVGDEVAVGDTVVVLEAMKMANNLEAEKAGKVTAVLVQVGESVMEDTPLVVIE
ncbi:biotin/lipoyl-containing protein [Prevotella sp.]|uniref:biotin/lipoyl-containing protein n=1 Tax=Prevotella sp. TaxID=59823 RepID=UPI003FD83211